MRHLARQESSPHRKKPPRALHHFFEAEVRVKLTVIENVLCKRTSPSKKRDHLLSHTAFYFSIEKKKGLSCP
jgi:hypothetical protein